MTTKTAEKKPRTLFEISSDLLELYDFLEETGGDISNPEVEAQIDAFLSSLGAERDEKLDNYCALIKEVGATAEIRKQESNRIAGLARVGENLVQRLKDRLKWFMETHKLTDKGIETRRFNVKVQANGGTFQPLEIKVPSETLPEEFVEAKEVTTTVYEVRAEILIAALSDSEHPLHAKAVEVAKLNKRGTHVRIR